MSDRAAVAAPAGRAPRRRATLGPSLLAIAAAATTSAALVWAALLHDATQKHGAADAAAATQGVPEAGGTQPAPALAPVTTRTS